MTARIDISTLEKKLNEIEKFEKRIQDSIKDEREAQPMYRGMAQDAGAIGKEISDNDLTSMSTEINQIKDQESRHEKQFTGMQRRLTTIKSNLKKRIEKMKKEQLEEQRKLAEKQQSELQAQKDQRNKIRANNMNRKRW